MIEPRNGAGQVSGVSQSGPVANALVEIYTKTWCPFCARAKALLEAKGQPYVEYEISDDPAKAREMRARYGGHTVPQIFINGRPVGGSDDLVAMERTGSLDLLLATPGSVAA